MLCHETISHRQQAIINTKTNIEYNEFRAGICTVKTRQQAFVLFLNVPIYCSTQQTVWARSAIIYFFM